MKSDFNLNYIYHFKRGNMIFLFFFYLDLKSSPYIFIILMNLLE